MVEASVLVNRWLSILLAILPVITIDSIVNMKLSASGHTILTPSIFQSPSINKGKPLNGILGSPQRPS